MSQYHKGKNFYDFYTPQNLNKSDRLYHLTGLCINKENKKYYGVHIYNLNKLAEEDIQSLRSMIELVAQFDHPNIAQLIEVYENDNDIFMILDTGKGKSLHDLITEQEYVDEKQSAQITFILTNAVKYYQSLDIVHRDLNGENIIFESIENLQSLKITNFIYSKTIIDNDDLAITACGNPNWLAPEIVEGNGYGKEVDIWSIGFIIYVSLCGFPPFYEENNQKLFEKIKKAEFDYPSPYWDDISDEAKDCINKILVADPKQRLTLDQILEHKWIQEYTKNQSSNMCSTF